MYSNEFALHSVQLQIRSKVLRRWDTRYLVLYQDRIELRKSATGSPNRIFRLTKQSKCEDSNIRSFCFRVFSETDELILHAKDAKEKDSCSQKITFAISLLCFEDPPLDESIQYTRRELYMKVIKARNLLGKNLIKSTGIFVRIQVGNSCVETDIVSRNFNPTWNENFNFEFDRSMRFARIEVLNRDQTKQDNFLGMVVVPLGGVTDKKTCRWYRLGKKSRHSRVRGEIKLQFYGNTPRCELIERLFQTALKIPELRDFLPFDRPMEESKEIDMSANFPLNEFVEDISVNCLCQSCPDKNALFSSGYFFLTNYRILFVSNSHLRIDNAYITNPIQLTTTIPIGLIQSVEKIEIKNLFGTNLTPQTIKVQSKDGRFLTFMFFKKNEMSDVTKMIQSNFIFDNNSSAVDEFEGKVFTTDKLGNAENDEIEGTWSTEGLSSIRIFSRLEFLVINPQIAIENSITAQSQFLAQFQHIFAKDVIVPNSEIQSSKVFQAVHCCMTDDSESSGSDNEESSYLILEKDLSNNNKNDLSDHLSFTFEIRKWVGPRRTNFQSDSTQLTIIEEKANNSADEAYEHNLHYEGQVYCFDDEQSRFGNMEQQTDPTIHQLQQGWKILNLKQEYARLNIPDPDGRIRLTQINSKYGFCSTYPELFAVPGSIDDKTMETAADFRSGRRVPVIVWQHPLNFAVISRSSQPCVGITYDRNIEDEKLVQALSSNPKVRYGSPITDRKKVNDDLKKKKLIIIDARPRINATANHLHGKGVENPDLYAPVQFMNIENIHRMRQSVDQLTLACTTVTMDNFYRRVEMSEWLKHLSHILSATLQIIKLVAVKGVSCLIHCSDGWDRTSQLSALSQLLMDPYYRTLQGFEVLIEKEWLSFGHQFKKRMGVSKKDIERSPIFHQFLDCVHQIMIQYPNKFQFNEQLLIFLVYHSYSGWFGTFLTNSPQEAKVHQLSHKTLSIWSYVNVHQSRFINPNYELIPYSNSTADTKSHVIDLLVPIVSPSRLKNWDNWFFSWHDHLTKLTWFRCDKLINNDDNDDDDDGTSSSVDWQNDNEVINCPKCLKQFTLRVRKHHCRCCGRVICSACSKNFEVLNKGIFPVRICDDCTIARHEKS